MIERVAGVVGRQPLVVQRIGGLATDDMTVALEQLEAHDTGHSLLNLLHERVEGLAQRREPQAVVNQIGIVAADKPREALEVPGDDQLLQLLVSGVEQQSRREPRRSRAT